MPTHQKKATSNQLVAFRKRVDKQWFVGSSGAAGWLGNRVMIQLVPQHEHIRRCLNSESYFVSRNSHNRYHNRLAQSDAFGLFAR